MTNPTYPSFVESVGRTPLVRLSRICPDVALFAKHESRNPAGSVKDRVAVAMVLDAEARGALRKGMTIIEPTSGNTGVALAAVAASRGYSLTLTMPETMSIERRKLLSALGAGLVLTPGAEGMKGAIARAEVMAAEEPSRYFMPQQFTNPANPKAHFETTGPEIWGAMQGDVDVFIAGVGTGGTISGVGKFLREKNPDIEIIAVEPSESPVITQQVATASLSSCSAVPTAGMPLPHRIQGIGAGFIPKALDVGIISRVIQVSSDDAFETMHRMAKTEGLLAGISSGAAVCAALQVASEPAYQNKRIVTILPDGAERYLSLL